MTTLCLTMIVKDEAHVIERCLDSVLPIIDSWVIVDTGSSDGTQDVIRAKLAGVPGHLHERPWVNFGHNRSEAISLARGVGDYLLFMDADDTLYVPDGFTLPELTEPAYHVDFEYGSTGYRRTAVVDNALPWRFEGVLHEFPTCDQQVNVSYLPGPVIQIQGGGGRSAVSNEEKYRRDAEVLKQGLRDEPGNLRYLFYLAQSYRDAGDTRQALETYEKRAAAGGWVEEVWYSLLQVAILTERLERSEHDVVNAYLRAYEHRPTRAEPLMHLARYYRQHGERCTLAHLYARQAIDIPRPDDVLFVDEDTYRWRALDEYSIACYWTERYEESRRAAEQLLASSHLPEEQRERVLANLNFSRAKLGLEPATV